MQLKLQSSSTYYKLYFTTATIFSKVLDTGDNCLENYSSFSCNVKRPLGWWLLLNLLLRIILPCLAELFSPAKMLIYVRSTSILVSCLYSKCAAWTNISVAAAFLPRANFKCISGPQCFDFHTFMYGLVAIIKKVQWEWVVEAFFISECIND